MSTKQHLLSVTALTAILLGAPSVSDAFESTYYKSGVTAGIHGGASYMWGRVKSTFSTAVLAPVPAAGSASKTNGFFGGLLGYRYFLNSGVSLGADVTVNYYGNNDLNKRLNHKTPANVLIPFDNKVSRTFGVTPSFVIGRVFNERFYANLGLGLGISRFEQKIRNVAANISVKGSKTQLGFVPSVGLEYAINPKWAVTGNVAYEYYGRVKRNFGREVNPTVVGINYNTSINPNIVTGRLGVIYKF